jgi:hypothetical protein
MGWLFGRKKAVPKVPFPQGQAGNPKTLRFPDGKSEDKVIQPKQVKAAVGFEKPMNPPQSKPMPMPESKPLPPRQPMPSPVARQPLPTRRPLPPRPQAQQPAVPVEPRANPFMGNEEGPLYIKINVYQRILGEVGLLHKELTELSHCNRVLENSEYNEEADFAKLRRSMRQVHDKLLDVDKRLFSSQR